MGLLEILGMMLFGLIAGAIARLLMPGRQVMGLLATMVLGIVGSFVGGFLAFLITGGDAFRTSGWIASILGAVVVLLLLSSSAARRA
ncbi:MAG: GlsB/YeaQ/YmgE family stress response membrane protein [Planctomycetaceae bacterium]|nr:GlsB/YeaQ/YmgE family stress response membrane protein [Planctomycetaceae bacterium]